MKRQKDRFCKNSQGVYQDKGSRMAGVGYRVGGGLNLYLDGGGVQRGMIEFWGTSVPTCVSTTLKMSRGNTGEEIYLVATM